MCACAYVCTHAKSLQLCSTLCDPMDCSPPDSSVHRISQARIWSGLSFPSPGDHPDPGIKLEFLTLSPMASRFFTTSATWEARGCVCVFVCV